MNLLTSAHDQVFAMFVSKLSQVRASKRCVFFDRDGVINRSPGQGYVLSKEDFFLIEGIGNLLNWLHSRDWLAIVVSSQRCVGKGLIDLPMLASIHASMQQDLQDRYGSNFDAIYAFTGLPATESWSKPRPGMIDQACMDHVIDPLQSIMIGDQDRDIQMAINSNIGCTIRCLDPQESRSNLVLADEYVVSADDMVDRLKSVVQRMN